MNDEAASGLDVDPDSSSALRRGRWLALLAASLGWMFDGFEMGLHPLVAHPALHDLLGRGVVEAMGPAADPAAVAAAVGAAVGRWNAIMNALFLFGAALGGFVFGWLGDRIGRTRALTFTILTYALLTGLAGFSTSVWHLAAARFLSAIGMGGEWSLGVALVMEMWPASARPLLAGIIGAVGNVGYMLIAFTSLGLNWAGGLSTASWRPLMFVGVAPAFVVLLIRLAVPESPKWRESVAKSEPVGPLEALGPATRGSVVISVFLMGVALLGTWGAVQWIPLWTVDLAGRSTSGAKEYAQIAAGAGAVVGTLAAALLCGRFGRRPVYFVMCLLSLATTGWLFRVPQTFGPAYLTGVFAVGLATAAFYGWAPLYLPELFPTRVRATAQGIAYNFGRAFAAVGTLVLTGTMLDRFRSDLASSLAFTSLIYIVGLGLIWFAPETRGKPLPD